MAHTGRGSATALPPGSDSLDLVDGLAQLTFAVQGALGRIAASYELSITQARLLGVLRDRRPTITDLASLLGLDKSSVTGLVDRAKERGLVRRRPSTVDRRSVQVEITAAGRRLVSEALGEFAAQMELLVQALSETQKAQLRSIASLLVATDANHADARRRFMDSRAGSGS